MILRAIFWIGLVALLMPRGPDLGLGHPGAGASLSSRIASLAASSLPKPREQFREQCSAACVGSLGVLNLLQSASGRNLAEVKAEIDQSIHARHMRQG